MQDFNFQGVDAPLRLLGAETVLPHLPDIFVGWPFRRTGALLSKAPFFSIRSHPGEALLRCESHVDDRPAHRFDPVNAICDAIASLALALPAERSDLICLHAAGVAMGGRLVVFPNIRRAGKSTLSIALARAGHALFSDDVLPVSFPATDGALGHAMGIAPRLRLPLPATLDEDFRLWAAAAAGPRNRQDHYVALDRLPVHGTTLPIGAFVILDRQDDPCATRLVAVAPDAAMDALLHQHFTRDRHSADVLQAVAAMLTDRPVLRLTYSGLADAVACLEAAFMPWPGGDLPVPAGPARSFRGLGPDQCRPVVHVRGLPLVQRQGTVAQVIGEGLYLADREGRAIHRLDPLAAAIWSVLEAPTTPPEIVALLAEAFPEAGRDRIAGDVSRLLEDFEQAGLIEPPAESVPGGPDAPEEAVTR